MALMTTFGVPAIYYWLGNTAVYTSTISTIFGEMNQAVFFSTFFSAMFLPLTGLMELAMYKRHKDSLKKEKTRTNENQEFRVVKVNDLERLKKFKGWLKLYYDLGYNGEKYYRYYQQGKLDGKLGKYYTDVGIETAKEYLEEKINKVVTRSARLRVEVAIDFFYFYYEVLKIKT